ncbi:hypothetical protein F8M41_015780 [Gigaspora margarita]|uniref:Uncharacterized protein n=1 Tax=Gigaspora margarita TaxID=4874 RepID=A0A8H4AQE5_GIGMA|nr:hypothetical protein F8M41_015780 [Gigaspora margarita]
MFSVPGPSSLASSSTSFLIEDTKDIECSDNHSNEDYVEAGTSSARKRKHKSAEVTQKELSPPSNFKPLRRCKISGTN